MDMHMFRDTCSGSPLKIYTDIISLRGKDFIHKGFRLFKKIKESAELEKKTKKSGRKPVESGSERWEYEDLLIAETADSTVE